MALNIIKCIFCGQLFQNSIAKYCPKCAYLLDDYFALARDYLIEHPNASVEHVVAETEIPIKYLNYLIKSDRLVRVAPSLTYTTCEVCKKPVSGTRYCKSCQLKLSNAFTSAVGSTQQSPTIYTNKQKNSSYTKEAGEMYSSVDDE